MSILNKITTGRRGRAQRVVIYGPEGFGKSSLAACFPNPLFLDVEDSTAQLNVVRISRDDLPDLESFESALDEILKNRACGTLVTDTVDWLEEVAAKDVCKTFKAEHLEKVDGGYGKGYSYLTSRVGLTLAKLDRLIEAGIHVVLLAHSSIVRFNPPDGAGEYDRYELKLYKDRKGGKGTASLIKEWADMVLFCNWRTQVEEKGKGDNTKYKGVGGRERMIYANRCAAWDAKNRHGMPDEQPWGKDQTEAIKVIEKAFRSVGAPWQSATPIDGGKIVASDPPIQTPVEGMQSTAIVEQKAAEDDIPMQHDANGKPVLVDTEIHRICQPHFEAVNRYLVATKRVKAGQTFADIDETFANRIKRNPAAFLKAVGTNGGAI